MATAVNSATERRRRRHELIGVVTSSKMQKTIVVRVTRQIQHRLYQRYVHVAKKFYAHDEQGEARPGDVVRIVETRPMSKLKRWRLAEVLTRRTSVD
jgi:small subunit ribosomal protein S17